jgi:hypothetical protein
MVPSHRENSDPWTMDKDGKKYWGPRSNQSTCGSERSRRADGGYRYRSKYLFTLQHSMCAGAKVYAYGA